MVDSVSGAGGPSNLGSVNRTQNNRSNADSSAPTEGTQGAAQTDQVDVSDAALEVQILAAAQEARAALEQDSAAILSSDAERISQLL